MSESAAWSPAIGRSACRRKNLSLAAGIEDAVEEMQEAQKQLYNAAKSMNMSDAEAKAFAEPI